MLRSALLALGLSLVVGCSSATSDLIPAPPPGAEPAVDTNPSDPAPGETRDGEESEDGEQGPAPEVPVATPGAPALGGQLAKWSWLDVPGTECGNGEATGLGVNLGSGGDLVVFLQGGGGCWDELTCGAGAAKHVKDGYRKETFEADLAEGAFADAQKGGLFDRGLATNPYKDSSFIFIPYCTGDVHAGDATQQFFLPPRTMHYSGRKNIQAFLGQITPAFAQASRVTLMGESAGGFGAALNYWRVQDAFGKTRVDLVDDSGPPFEAGNIPLLGAWKKSWALDGALPPSCPKCVANLAEIPAHYAKTYPSSRLAFLSHEQDKIISLFFVTPQPIFESRLHAMANDRIKPLANARFFLVPGTEHTMLRDLGRTSGTNVLGPWLGQMKSDSPAWANVAP